MGEVKPYYRNDEYGISLHLGDCLDVLDRMPAESVQCCVTSPPYWGLRDYKVDGQLGLEPTPDEFVANLVEVFRKVRRVLRPDGTVWLNMGDSYTSGGRGTYRSGSSDNKGHQIQDDQVRPKQPRGLKPKDMCGIPWRVAFALQADGWWLRQDIIWHKPNPMPESCTDRCTKAHEYIFLLSKSPRYFFDHEAIKEPSIYPDDDRKGRANGEHKRYPTSEVAGIRGGSAIYPSRNKRSVWTVNTQSFKDAHFATFPEKLIEPCILAGTSERGCCADCGAPWERLVDKNRTFESGSGKSGNAINSKQGPVHGGGETVDIRRGPCLHTKTVGWQPTCTCDAGTVACTVLDPFAGSATVGVVCIKHGRQAALIELSPEYATMAEKRLKAAIGDPMLFTRPVAEVRHHEQMELIT